MTLTQERELGIAKMYLHDKNGALKSWGTHRQTRSNALLTAFAEVAANPSSQVVDIDDLVLLVCYDSSFF